ncbi:ABC transporter ATP-binding protein [Oribacterium sp. C9]|uniref:ABC transporter ATP-binding protein n=1 Tax=Oribacterium sp. C9 TaxID=1943579 RepID=UPI00098F9E9A|nr:ATP-binding cassette domain-containing protein [Oribacterium sp. C9]OON86692.1 ABC transporter ATP-binding protein [Oribacterium sp. C9]
MLELQNISFQVDAEGQDKEIIRDISLTIPDDKLVVITGPNGGGKSTLARLIIGIEKPTSGRILFDGEDITDLSITERAKKGLGFAFQQPVRFKGIQVFDLIKLATGKNISIVDACKYLAEVGLCAKDYIDREVNSSLSGGELKRIEIATVLAKASKMSVFDEPEAGIDLWSFQNLIEVFQRMREKISNSSILIISHQERILNIADEIIVIKDGSVVKRGSKSEILPELMGTSMAVPGCNKVESVREAKQDVKA